MSDHGPLFDVGHRIESATLTPRGCPPEPFVKMPAKVYGDGQVLRDLALAQSAEGRQERIAMVRGYLIAYHRDLGSRDLTGDDVMWAVEELGFADGDRRWTASVLKGWGAVRPTGHYRPSDRPECHARPKLIWRWR